MKNSDRMLAGFGVTALVLYALMYGAFSWIKLDPRPGPMLLAFVDANWTRVCPEYLQMYPKTPNGVYGCAQSVREIAMMIALFLPLPLTMLIGSFFVVLTHLGLGSLIIRTSSPLSGAVKRGFELIKLEPGLLALPALSSFVVSVLLGFAFWKAFSDPRAAEISRDQLSVLAWTMIMTPPMIAGYFATAFALLLTNAALIHGYLAHARGARASLGSAMLASARLAPVIAVLTVSVFGALLMLYWTVGRVSGAMGRRFGFSFAGGPADAARFAGFFIESGLLIGAQLVVAAMLAENIGLVPALRRVSVMIKPAGREILTAAFGMATMRHDACATAVFGPFMAGYLCLPLFMEHIALGMSLAVTAGILCGSLYFSLLMALEAVFAAGIYVYARDGKVLPGLEKRDLAGFIGDLEVLKAGR